MSSLEEELAIARRDAAPLFAVQEENRQLRTRASWAHDELERLRHSEADLIAENRKLASQNERLTECIGEDTVSQCRADDCFCCPEHPDCGHHESPTGDD